MLFSPIGPSHNAVQALHLAFRIRATRAAERGSVRRVCKDQMTSDLTWTQFGENPTLITDSLSAAYFSLLTDTQKINVLLINSLHLHHGFLTFSG